MSLFKCRLLTASLQKLARREMGVDPFLHPRIHGASSSLCVHRRSFALVVPASRSSRDGTPKGALAFRKAEDPPIPVAIVGRANVGKSTLFNRLVALPGSRNNTRHRRAIVSNIAGTTRNRKEAVTRFGGMTLKMIDTGGVEGEEATSACGLLQAMRKQVLSALEESEAVLFLIDARASVTALDELIARMLVSGSLHVKKRRTNEAGDEEFEDVPVILVANKAEGAFMGDLMNEVYRLNLGDPVLVSAERNFGLDDLYDRLAMEVGHLQNGLFHDAQESDAEASESSDESDMEELGDGDGHGHMALEASSGGLSHAPGWLLETGREGARHSGRTSEFLLEAPREEEEEGSEKGSASEDDELETIVHATQRLHAPVPTARTVDWLRSKAKHVGLPAPQSAEQYLHWLATGSAHLPSDRAESEGEGEEGMTEADELWEADAGAEGRKRFLEYEQSGAAHPQHLQWMTGACEAGLNRPPSSAFLSMPFATPPRLGREDEWAEAEGEEAAATSPFSSSSSSANSMEFLSRHGAESSSVSLVPSSSGFASEWGHFSRGWDERVLRMMREPRILPKNAPLPSVDSPSEELREEEAALLAGDEEAIYEHEHKGWMSRRVSGLKTREQRAFVLSKRQRVMFDKEVNISFIGQPNSGKSSLVNALLHSERMVVDAVPGSTVDSVIVKWSYKGHPVKIHDTAGMTRGWRVRGNELEVEAARQTLRCIRASQVCVLCVDATDRDGHLGRFDLQVGHMVTEKEWRVLVLAITKWDLVDDGEKEKIVQRVLDQAKAFLSQVKGMPIVFVSSHQGQNLELLMNKIMAVYRRWNARVPTTRLNKWLREFTERFPPPWRKGTKANIKFACQVKTRPPTFVLWSSMYSKYPPNYLRRLLNNIREEFNLPGTPVRMCIRCSNMPPVGRRLSKQEILKWKRRGPTQREAVENLDRYGNVKQAKHRQKTS